MPIGGGGGRGACVTKTSSKGASAHLTSGPTRSFFRNNQFASVSSSSSSGTGSEAQAFVKELHAERSAGKPFNSLTGHRQRNNMVDCLNSGQRYVRFLADKSLTITVANDFPHTPAAAAASNNLISSDYVERYGSRKQQENGTSKPLKETRFRSQSLERQTSGGGGRQQQNNMPSLRRSNRSRGGARTPGNGRPMSAYFASSPPITPGEEWTRQKSNNKNPNQLQWSRSHENGSSPTKADTAPFASNRSKAKPAVDDETSSYNNDDLEQYRLKIDMDGFIVDKPCTMDPILTVPLSPWRPELFDRTKNDCSSQTNSDPRIRPKKKLIDIEDERRAVTGDQEEEKEEEKEKATATAIKT